MDQQCVIEYLRQLPDEELVAVLQGVFADRQPCPEEAAFCRNSFFLGIAFSDLESADREPKRWGAWDVEAVAYPDPTVYRGSLGPNWGLCQSGTCGSCGVNVRSNVKQGLCPICKAAVSMT